jgi:hypothetical protein
MGGNAQVETYFQDDTTDEPKLYRGELDPRDHTARQKDLPPQLQLLANILDERVRARCKDGCVIEKEAQGHIGHAVGIIRELGDGKIETGLNRGRDMIKRLDATFDRIDKNKDTLSTTVVRSLGTLLLVMLGYGIVEFIKFKLGG